MSQNQNFIVKLDRYIFLKDETKSLIIFKIFLNNDIVAIKKISYECHPILDVELLNLNDITLLDMIKKLHKIVINKQFKNRFLTCINNFKKNLLMEFFPQVLHLNPTYNSNNILVN